MHSATKSIAGHNDATLGVVVGAQDLISWIWSYHTIHGAVASPFDALNGLRGIRTLGVRVRHQSASAQRIAEMLLDHPKVAAVYYPGLDSHPQRDLAKRQMALGGSVLSFEVAGGWEAGRLVAESLRLGHLAPSLGGPETLVTHVASTTAAIALGLVLGGAAGNLSDRVFRAPGPLRGAVVDFVAIGWAQSSTPPTSAWSSA